MAPSLANRGLTILLYDRSNAVRQRLRDGSTAVAGVRGLDDAELARLPPGSVDMVLIKPVVQYLSEAEFDALLSDLARLLWPGGRLLLGDVIEPGTPMHRDILSLLALALRHGFVTSAIFGLAATFFSPYRRLRKTIGLSCYSCEAVLAKLAAAGFAARRLPTNVGPSAHRLCFLAERPAARTWKPAPREAGANSLAG